MAPLGWPISVYDTHSAPQARRYQLNLFAVEDNYTNPCQSLQIMMYTHAISGDPLASRFVYPVSPSGADLWAAAILSSKLKTYTTFNASYPGFGGFLPKMIVNETQISPTSESINTVSGLDNGKLLWSVYGLVTALHQSNKTQFRQLGDGWQKWLDHASQNAARVFYRGSGRVCAVVGVNQTLPPTDQEQNYTCEGTEYLDDPYGGELFTWWLYFFGSLSASCKEQLWLVKRPQLRAINYTGSIVNTDLSFRNTSEYKGLPVQVGKSIKPITVQQGFWFSSHEQWKILEMPYLDLALVKRLFHNAERVRTCNSVLMGQNAGMFASVAGVTDTITTKSESYISAAGIPSIASETAQRLDVITPCSTFPTMLFNQSVALAWYLNILQARGMQNSYGSSASTRRDGTGISTFVSWENKVPTLVGLVGGIGDFVRAKMKEDGIYDEFLRVLSREYELQFGSTLYGEDVDMCLPDFKVPVSNVTDFSHCS